MNVVDHSPMAACDRNVCLSQLHSSSRAGIVLQSYEVSGLLESIAAVSRPRWWLSRISGSCSIAVMYFKYSCMAAMASFLRNAPHFCHSCSHEAQNFGTSIEGQYFRTSITFKRFTCSRQVRSALGRVPMDLYFSA